MSQYDYLFRVVLIGDNKVGKSTLFYQFAAQYCPRNFNTGIECKIRSLEIDNKIVKLQIWDTSNQQRLQTTVQLSCRRTQSFILVYSITDRESFINIRKWFREIQKYAHEDTVKVLIASKCDRGDERQVTLEEGKSYAEKFGMKFMEASAIKMTNVEEILITIVRDIMNKVRDNEGIGDLKKILDIEKEVKTKIKTRYFKLSKEITVFQIYALYVKKITNSKFEAKEVILKHQKKLFMAFLLLFVFYFCFEDIEVKPTEL